MRIHCGGSCEFPLDFLPLDYFNYAATSSSFEYKGPDFHCVKDTQALFSQSKGVSAEAAQSSSHLLPPSCQVSYGWGEGGSSGDQASPMTVPGQMLNFSRAADERCGWKLLGAQPFGGAHTARGRGQPTVTALLGAPSRAQRGTSAVVGVCPCRRRWQRLTLPSGFAEMSNLSFLLGFLSKTLSDPDSNCTKFFHFGVI